MGARISNINYSFLNNKKILIQILSITGIIFSHYSEYFLLNFYFLKVPIRFNLLPEIAIKVED